MRKLASVLAFAVLIAACGGDTDAVVAEGGNGSDLPDPCTLVDQSTLDAYFVEDVTPEPGEVGPLLTCKWRDSNANSLLVQVADDFPVTKPDPCDGCTDLAFGDDGYATSVSIQSTAEFIAEGVFYSVTTTGLGDDQQSIAALAETIYLVATG
jgi:hypothetical protein